MPRRRWFLRLHRNFDGSAAVFELRNDYQTVRLAERLDSAVCNGEDDGIDTCPAVLLATEGLDGGKRIVGTLSMER